MWRCTSTFIKVIEHIFHAYFHRFRILTFKNVDLKNLGQDHRVTPFGGKHQHL